MSEAEYGAIRNAVFAATGVARAESEMGRLPAEAVSDATRHLRDALRVALERARAEGLPGTDHVSDEDVERIDEALSRAGAEGSEVAWVSLVGGWFGELQSRAGSGSD